jgi:hypothetical protein
MPFLHAPPGTPSAGGLLFDRLEDVLGWGDMLLGMAPIAPTPPMPAMPSGASSRSAAAAAAAQQQAGTAETEGAAAAAAGSIITCCLARRTKPERNPPRIVVLCGPGAVGKGALARQLVADNPDKFGLTISTTTRLPREHEVEGRCALGWAYAAAATAGLGCWPVHEVGMHAS